MLLHGKKKIVTLVNYEVSEENREIKLIVSEEDQTEKIVIYSDIESIDYADNDERLNIWVYFNNNESVRFHLFYTETE